MISNCKLAVCIPAYRVQSKIQSVIRSIPEYVDHIIVIDDACPNSSGKVAEAVGDKRVVVIYLEKNQGVGGAVSLGYRKALEYEADIIIKMDGDGQMDPSYLKQIISPIMLGEADYVKANRYKHFSALKSMPKARLFGNSVLSFCVKLCSGYWNIMDPNNGYTGISREALGTLELEKLSKRYFFEIDILINLNIQNSVVEDTAIPASYGDEESSLKISRIMVEFPMKLLKGLIKRILKKYFLNDFNMASVYLLVGTPMLLWGVGFGLYRWGLAIFKDIINSSGTVMLSVLPLILGTQFILQAISIDINSVPKRK